MNGASGDPENDDVMPDDAAHAAVARAQIEQRLRDVFRLAGDCEPARQLLRMVVEYRWGQLS